MILSMNLLFQNFKEVFANKRYLFFSIFLFLIFIFIFFLITDDELIRGNLGIIFYSIVIFLNIGISLLFSIFLSIFMYKYIKFSSFSTKEGTSSIIGSFFGVLLTGCPACSLSLASYLGFASILSFLPFFGLELKILGFIILFYANYSILKNLNNCNIKKKKVKKIKEEKEEKKKNKKVKEEKEKKDEG